MSNPFWYSLRLFNLFIKTSCNCLPRSSKLFAQKILFQSMPGADQLFHFLVTLYNFFSIIYHFTLITSSLIFSAIVLIHLLCGVLVSSPQFNMPAQNSTDLSIFHTVPLLYQVLSILIQVSSSTFSHSSILNNSNFSWLVNSV